MLAQSDPIKLWTLTKSIKEIRKWEKVVKVFYAKICCWSFEGRVLVTVSNFGTFSWKCTGKTGTFLLVHTGTFSTCTKRSKVDGRKSKIENSGIIFVIFDHFLSHIWPIWSNLDHFIDVMCWKFQKLTVIFDIYNWMSKILVYLTFDFPEISKISGKRMALVGKSKKLGSW